MTFDTLSNGTMSHLPLEKSTAFELDYKWMFEIASEMSKNTF